MSFSLGVLSYSALSFFYDVGDISRMSYSVGFDTVAAWFCDYRRRIDNRVFRFRYVVDYRLVAMLRLFLDVVLVDLVLSFLFR